jgi:hypothetical protein
MASEHKVGEVGTEIAPEIADDPEVAGRVDVLLRQACHLARSLTEAEQGAIAYGLLQLSDKHGDADFTEEDEVRLRELSHLVGAALDALRLSAA